MLKKKLFEIPFTRVHVRQVSVRVRVGGTTAGRRWGKIRERGGLSTAGGLCAPEVVFCLVRRANANCLLICHSCPGKCNSDPPPGYIHPSRAPRHRHHRPFSQSSRLPGFPRTDPDATALQFYEFNVRITIPIQRAPRQLHENTHTWTRTCVLLLLLLLRSMRTHFSFFPLIDWTLARVS